MNQSKTADMWLELFEMWLRSIGCNIIRDHFVYKGCRYKIFIDYNLLDIAPVSEDWAWIDLDTSKDDLTNPSFDPDVFFAPFKKFMDAR